MRAPHSPSRTPERRRSTLPKHHFGRGTPCGNLPKSDIRKLHVPEAGEGCQGISGENLRKPIRFTSPNNSPSRQRRGTVHRTDLKPTESSILIPSFGAALVFDERVEQLSSTVCVAASELSSSMARMSRSVNAWSRSGG
ncbi:MAG TPA: hypothetical protein DDX19_23175 [Rhodopirellula baltica]|nr:hypothetical protein [Rhodopirellula baltica]